MKLVKGLPRPAKSGEPVAIDLEMFKMQDGKLHRPIGQFAAMTVSFPPQETVYMVMDQPDVQRALDRLKDGQWIFHNSLFDLRHLRRFAKFGQRKVHDTMICEQDLFGGYYDGFGLNDLTRRWLGLQMPKDVRAEFGGRESMTKDMEEYAAFDAYATGRVALAQLEYAEGAGESLKWYWDIDEPAVWAFLDFPGVLIDVDGWIKNAEEMGRNAAKIQEELGFNPGSPVQARDRINAMLPKSWKPLASTNADKDLEPLLRRLRAYHSDKAAEMVQAVLDARSYKKMASSYGIKWIETNVEGDGRVYTSYWVTGAETGRTASSNPSLHNVPARDFPIFRTFFLASPGNDLLVSDVSQQEPRFLCYMSGDENMLEIFRSGANLHEATAEQMKGFGADLDYRQAKDINLGTSYGLTAWGLSNRTGISKDEAEDFIAAYFKLRPRVASWIDRTRIAAQKFGVVRTAADRPIHINLHKWQWSNNAINGPIQGSAADQLKMALGMVHRAGVIPTLQVHDEIVIEVPKKDKKTEKLIREAWLDSAAELAPGVPFEVELARGANWGCKEE